MCRTRPISRAWTMTRPVHRHHRDARVLACSGDSITTDHISPAGSIKEDSPAGDYLKESGRPAGLQLLRLAARQSRGDDARHVRQHPHQEPDGAGRRRRRDRAPSRPANRCRSMTRRCATGRERAADCCSPARNTAPGSRRVTGRPRARRSAGRASRHRRELRAHPPLQPGRHGRAAAEKLRCQGWRLR
jgi:aconitate hydratase